MKLYDLQDELENLQIQLTVIRETANALKIALEREELTVEQAGWILFGIKESVGESEAKAGRLVKETIEMRKILEVLQETE